MMLAKRTFRLAAVTACALGVVVVGQAHARQAQSATEGEPSCFECEDWRGPDGLYWHTDFSVFVNSKHGEAHTVFPLPCFMHSDYLEF